MTKKIGRNDPCPCGSGKKYKNCCMLSGESKDFSEGPISNPLQFSGLDAPKLKSYLESHDVTPIIDYLIALQLNPANNGKNLRLEHISQLVVSSIGMSNVTPDLSVFKQLVDEEYPYDMMEDVPINMYCETVLFHGGNYVFFPGLSTHCSELFRAMTESIYRVDDVFPQDFKNEIYQGVSLLLELGNGIASRAGIKRMTRGNDSPREKISSPLLTQSHAIPKSLMESLLHKYHAGKELLGNFLLDRGNPDILTSNPEKNPILYYPIIECGDNFYFLGISNQGCAINNFILKTAVKYNCLGELVQYTQETIWNRIGLSCFHHMHWVPIEFEGLLARDDHYNEELFRIDENWLAYVCYATDTVGDISVDGSEQSARWDIDSRLKNTLATIRGNEKTREFHVLTLLVYSSMGEPFALQIGKQAGADYLIWFSAFEFLQLVQTEKWDSMSLVRYARTKDNTPALNYGYNQSLDCYSLYKNKGESFYVSDDPAPDFFQIEPNEGCELIHQSKEKLNFHGAPMHFDDGRIGFVPVQRDMDYAAIYHPLNNSLNAKCCESYPMPIWVRCSQTEGEKENPSSITDTVITAIAYWFDRLKPAILDRVIRYFKDSVEIDLQFEEDTLNGKFANTEQIKTESDGKITVSKTSSGANVHFNTAFIQGFMGSDNEQERQMMKAIISTMLGMQEVVVQGILDKLMPWGLAKMILMREASNSPISFPLWLNPPIYVHPASSQLMLDLFPKWMREKGFDIKGRLETKEQKVAFLHSGVDVLLGKLYEKVDVIDSHFLLKRLISNHETLLFQREQNKLLHPAQILCFGDNENKRREILDREQRLTDAGLATRALIEYVAATQGDAGSERVGSYDIEWLLTIMREINNIGGICDAIHLEVSEHTIEKLESGRYGIYDDSFNESVFSFASARSVESTNDLVEDFGDKLEYLADMQPRERRERNEELDEIDEAFISDWGVSYSSILQVFYCCYLIAMEQKQSVVELTEKEFEESMMKLCPELDGVSLAKALEHLSLEKRGDYLTPPAGLDGKDIFPWIYNRELSYLRRPLVKFQMEDGSIHIIFGFRSCLLAGMQLTDLLYAGRLKYVGEKMEQLSGKFQAEKGRAFNELVRAWLQDNTTLKVWPRDVSMKPKGILSTSTDLGDIDILAYDEEANIVFSVECKNTNTAKNVREMKKEMDDYLGRGENQEKDSKKALVLKHLRRHQWLKQNTQKVKDLVGAVTEPEIKSMILTSEVIPTSYLRKEDTPLSILNYQELKTGGVEYLNRAKEPSDMTDGVGKEIKEIATASARK